MRAFLTVIFVLLGAAVQAQEETAWSFIGNDVFAAGYAPRHDQAVAEDVFMAGNTVSVISDASGDVAIAGQNLIISGDVGGDVYVAGQSITISGDIGGDASLFGQEITVNMVGGNLRTAGQSVMVDGPIGGYAILGGEHVSVYGTIGGDVHLAAEHVTFAETASIGGTLHVYEDENTTTRIPAFISDSVDIERHILEDFPDEPKRHILKGFLSGVAAVAVLAALLAAVAPQRLANMRRGLLSQPFRGLWLGFLGLSVLTGAGLISALTIVGLLLTPALMLFAGLVAFVGYVVAAYSLGVGLMLAIGMDEPETLLVRAGAALLGSLSAAVVALAPFLGWLFVVVLTLAGTGAVVGQVIRPRFFVDET